MKTDKKRKKFVMLTDRDVKIFELISKFGVVSEKHLMWLCGWHDEVQGEKNIYKVRQRLTEGEWVASYKLGYKQPRFVILAKNGAALMNSTKVRKIPIQILEHDMYVIDLYLTLKAKHPEMDIETERQKRQYEGIRFGDKRRIPDLTLNNEIAIEVELTQKSTQRLKQIISSYLFNNKIKQVVYFVQSASIGKKIYEYGQNNDKFYVYLFSDDIRQHTELPRPISNAL